MPKSRNPMRREWMTEEGGFVPSRMILKVSPAWRHRPIPLIRILERIEIEHLRHGGAENGRLIVTYDQFVDHGVSRRIIRRALELGEQLGLLEIRQSGEWSGDVRAPNVYRLTYLPEGERRAPTDEWKSVTNEAALLAVKSYQAQTNKKSDSQCHNLQSISAITCNETASASAITCNEPVPERTPLYISGGKPVTTASPSKQARRERQHTTSAVPAPSPSSQDPMPKPLADALGKLIASAGIDIPENADVAVPATVAVAHSSAPQPSDAATATHLSDNDRALLKWMQGYDGMATHRITQQRMSGVLKGDQIAASALNLSLAGLIAVQEVENTKGTKSKIYQLTDEGRDPRLIRDDRQIDLEEWLGAS